MALADMVHEGDFKAIEAFLKSSTPAEVKAAIDKEPEGPCHQTNLSPLCAATVMCRVDLVNLLLDFGANINKGCGVAYYTALHYASLRGLLPLVRLLIERGAHPNVRNYVGETPLHSVISCRELRLDIIRYLVAMGAMVDHQDKEGNTPLHMAAAKNVEPIVKTLLDLGADINKENWLHQTPLATALNRSHNVLAQLMVREHKARVTEEHVNIAIYKQDSEILGLLLPHLNPTKLTKQQVLNDLLYLTCKMGYKPSILDVLVRNGADPMAPMGPFPDTAPICPLHMAIRYGHEFHYALLIKWGWLITADLAEKLKADDLVSLTDMRNALNLTTEVQELDLKKSWTEHLGALASSTRALTPMEEFLIRKIANKLL